MPPTTTMEEGLTKDGAWSEFLEVFDVGPGVAAVGVGGVFALSGEVIQFAGVRIHHNLLFIGVLERLEPGQHSIRALNECHQ